MESFSTFLTQALSAATVAALAASLVLIAAFLSNGRFLGGARKIAERYGLEIGLLVVLGAIAGSLAYSNVIGFPPCELCWIQRVFIYPQAVILGLAAWKKDKGGALYSFVLSVLGGLVALYHAYTQLGGGSLVPCTAAGGECSRVYFVEWGFVTIPLMAFAAFLLLALIAAAQMKRPTQQ